MNKTFGSICMVAGTAIGAGMIALPMALAKLGLVSMIALMVVTWIIVYYSALLGTELTLRLGKNLTLSEVSRQISGRGAEGIAMGCVVILSYALIAAYLYGGSSVVQALIAATTEKNVSLSSLLMGAALFYFIVLTLGIKWIDYVNRLMFFALIGFLGVTIVGLGSHVQVLTIPSMTETLVDPATWTLAIPVIFTSFGFQMMIPALSGYLNRDALQIKRAFFWGSLIPAAVYLAWTLTTLGTLTTNQPQLFQNIILGNVEVGEFVKMLSVTTAWHHLQVFVWAVSFFAIATSAFGVGLGLIDSWDKVLPSQLVGRNRQVFAAFITMVPSFGVALLIPGAFIKALSFAGMILVVIALILPTYLIYKSDRPQHRPAYPILQSPFVRWVCLLFAMGVVGCEVFNMVR
jgi:tyrosine-specific transport protein